MFLYLLELIPANVLFLPHITSVSLPLLKIKASNRAGAEALFMDHRVVIELFSVLYCNLLCTHFPVFVLFLFANVRVPEISTFILSSPTDAGKTTMP